MLDIADSLTLRIAAHTRRLRAASGVSLDTLAERTGVSRSMLSLIERGEASATAVVLERVATGLGVTLASLFDAESEGQPSAAGPVLRRADQLVWQDPGSGYRRRNVSPAAPAQPAHIVDVEFPAGARVVFESGARATHICQQVWVLDGAIDVTTNHVTHALQAGDCLAMVLGELTVFHNPTAHAARYAVIIETGAATSR
jgi:transcriptional regulator with XRE-family HTH domain